MPRPRINGVTAHKPGRLADGTNEIENENEHEHENENEPQRTSPSIESSSPVLSLHKHLTTPRFFNTSFSTHRVSPLHLGTNSFDPPGLAALSQRLRDALVGDIIRGVQVAGSADGSLMSRSGILENVIINWISVQDFLADDNNYDRSQSHNDTLKGLAIMIQYERASYVSILLPLIGDRNSRDSDFTDTKWVSLAPPAPFGTGAKKHTRESPTHSVHLPLLLMRMPAPLKVVVLEFLQVVFDTRVSTLRLGTRSLVQIWESWLRQSGADCEPGKIGNKDVAITLGFALSASNIDEKEDSTDQDTMEDIEYESVRADSSPAKTGLKTLDFFLPSKEIKRWCEFGKNFMNKKSLVHWSGDNMTRIALSGGKEEEGWGWRQEASSEQVFTEALAAYLHENLALDLFHPLVRIIKIACGGFVLTEERLKVFQPPSSWPVSEEAKAEIPEGIYHPVWSLISVLSQRAEGRAKVNGLLATLPTR